MNNLTPFQQRRLEMVIWLISEKLMFIDRYFYQPVKNEWGRPIYGHNQRLAIIRNELALQQLNGRNTKGYPYNAEDLILLIEKVCLSFAGQNKKNRQELIYLNQNFISKYWLNKVFGFDYRTTWRLSKQSYEYNPEPVLSINECLGCYYFVIDYFSSIFYFQQVEGFGELIKSIEQN